MKAQGRDPETDPAAISAYWTHRAVQEIKADPQHWFALMIKKSWLMLWNTEVPNNKSFAFLQEEFLWLRLLPVHWWLLLIFVPVGIWAATRKGNWDALFILLVFLVFYFAGNILFFICDRYRYPLWPAMAVLAGGGCVAVLELVRLRQRRAIAWASASIIAIAAISLPNWFGIKLPSFARDYFFRSVAWYEKGHFAEALNDIDRSVALDPADASALQQQGNVLSALNRLAEARQSYEQALKLYPDEAGTWNNLGVTLAALGQTENAVHAFHRATECQPPSRNAFFGMAFIQIRSGRWDEAAAAVEHLEKLETSSEASVLELRSIIERQHGNIPQAEALDHQARALDAEAAQWVIEQIKPSSH
jgi:tetratricopeptide (TPR) repeat protein